ncbi:MAG: SURF1 family protein [Gemmatimonadales bacterium]
MSSIARRLLLACFILAAAAFARLGFWQLGRLRERRAAGEVAAAARQKPAVVLQGEALKRSATLAQRRVIATGRYDPAHEVVLRGQALRGVPGVHLVTPLWLAESDTAVLVNRGFVPSPDAVSVVSDSLVEPGPVRVEGLALTMPAAGGQPLEHRGRTTWARLDLDALGSWLPYPVLPVYIQQSPDSSLPSFPRRLVAAPLGDGPHLNYAVQWFVFSGMTIVFAGVVLWQGRRAVSA